MNAANAGRRMVSIAETRADKILSCVAHRSVAGPSFMLGDFQSAFFHARASVGDFDPKLHSGLASRFGHDIGVGATGQYCIATPGSKQSNSRRKSSAFLPSSRATPSP